MNGRCGLLLMAGLAAVALATPALSGRPRAYRARVLRDRYGVPHIFGRTSP